MKPCWSEGTLKAYLDRELPLEDIERVAAHLGECPRCEARRAELAGRAARVSKLMDALPEPGQVTSLPLVTRQPRTAWQWAAAALLAAAAVIAFVLTPAAGPEGSPEGTPKGTPLPPVSSVAQVRPPLAEPEPSVQPTTPRRFRRQPVRPRSAPDYYLALDDEPIETGVVMRVALGPTEVPADVIFDQGGRARAIRLVK